MRRLKISVRPDELDKYVKGIGQHFDKALRLAQQPGAHSEEGVISR